MKKMAVILVMSFAVLGLVRLLRPNRDASPSRAKQGAAQLSTLPASGAVGTAKPFSAERPGDQAEAMQAGQRGSNVATASPTQSANGYEPGVQATIQKDIQQGINAEVRAKEARLRALTQQLTTGLTLRQTIDVLGQPDTIQSITSMTGGIHKVSRTIVRTNSYEEIGYGVGIRLGYWPRVGVAFDGRNGQGYEILFVLFDSQHQLESWSWSSPDFAVDASGFGGPVWEWMGGKQEKSGPPPAGIGWHY